jgi:hypothetical protein
MTGRVATMSMDGTPISQADIQRIEEEERLHRARQRKAALVVAATAHDADDCRLLLDILGLGQDVVRAARTEHAAAATTPRRRSRAA